MAKDSSTPPDQKPPSEYTPQACLTILGSFTGLFCTVGFMNSFGVFQEYYGKNQLADKSESTIAWLGAISIFCIFFISVFSGQLLDMFKPTLMLCVGSLGTVFSLMMVSLCKEFYQFILAQGILLGISLALLACPMLALVGQHIKVKRGAALGIVLGGSSLGGVIWPIAINELLQKPNIGFGWTMRIVAFIMIPLLSVSCICCRPPKISPTPTQRPASNDEEATITKAKPPVPKADFSILKKPSLQLSCLAFFIIYFGMFSPFFFTTSYAVAKGFSTDLAFYTISIVNGASFLVVFFLVLSQTATSVAGLVMFSLAYGFASGAILSLQQACAAQVATPQTIGLTMGTVMAATSFSALAGVPISGELAGKYGYLALSIYSGVSLLVGSVLLAAARFVQSRDLLAIV
ncbi:MFS monocarboxylate transporter [Aspergillus nomiae NRRL 13137]|uniref:MFS monocarboxylate transporter n=1 Tax=Aspergillus nomiae NRRL (strain ATCC 15546 / NRRL 13137 / CBS 260.88 / M93) TaxID=1509407 RepID=A0A0L1IL19_ASPN3|nr:MFS monocarboxylate transporter [Aspergillus nomiae NRRL 13137]KNG80207.1 MFS monocarboxylate transporter [Aspergillus nomiae NRRL 13137]